MLDWMIDINFIKWIFGQLSNDTFSDSRVFILTATKIGPHNISELSVKYLHSGTLFFYELWTLIRAGLLSSLSPSLFSFSRLYFLSFFFQPLFFVCNNALSEMCLYLLSHTSFFSFFLFNYFSETNQI